MNKKRKTIWTERVKWFVIGNALAVVVGIAGIAIATDVFRVDIGLDSRTADIVESVLQFERMGIAFGGSTADSLSIGGNLSVTGSTALTGSMTVASSTMSGSLDLDAIRYGGGILNYGDGTTDGAPGNATFTAAQICDNSFIMMYSGESTTIAIPNATSVISDCIETPGSCTKTWLVNESTSSVNFTVKAEDNLYGNGGGGTSLFINGTSSHIIASQDMAMIDICHVFSEGTAGVSTTATVIRLDEFN